jgi:hypothetical protein
MQNITSLAGLKSAIQFLEEERTINGQLLKNQLHLTYESLKPVNILKSALNDAISSPSLINNIVGTAIGLGTGYLSKKLIVGTSANVVKKLIGSVLQVGVTNFIAQHADNIKTYSQFAFQYFFHKNKLNQNSRD